MTTEQTHETGTPSVKITTNAKGHAQVEVKVYATPYATQFRHHTDGTTTIEPLELEALPGLMDEITTIAANAKRDLEAKIRGNGGTVAGDE